MAVALASVLNKLRAVDCEPLQHLMQLVFLNFARETESLGGVAIPSAGGLSPLKVVLLAGKVCVVESVPGRQSPDGKHERLGLGFPQLSKVAELPLELLVLRLRWL